MSEQQLTLLNGSKLTLTSRSKDVRIRGSGGLLIVDTPKPLSYEQAVYRVMKHGAWWTVRELRACILEDFGLDIEAITSRIRELRQRGHTIECERVPGSSAHRYRLASKEPA